MLHHRPLAKLSWMFLLCIALLITHLSLAASLLPGGVSYTEMVYESDATSLASDFAQLDTSQTAALGFLVGFQLMNHVCYASFVSGVGRFCSMQFEVSSYTHLAIIGAASMWISPIVFLLGMVGHLLLLDQLLKGRVEESKTNAMGGLGVTFIILIVLLSFVLLCMMTWILLYRLRHGLLPLEAHNAGVRVPVTAASQRRWQMDESIQPPIRPAIQQFAGAAT